MVYVNWNWSLYMENENKMQLLLNSIHLEHKAGIIIAGVLIYMFECQEITPVKFLSTTKCVLAI